MKASKRLANSTFKVFKVEYKLASNTWDLAELNAINRVIESQHFSMGERVAEYEKDFANYSGSKYSVMVSSGSSANLLMIASLFFVKDQNLRLKRGDEVIVPAVSWSTTYFPLQQYGLKVIFVDIDKETLNIDLKKLEKAVTNKTKLIFAVNLLGNSNNFKIIKEIIGKKNITLIEDNCESLGATFSNKKTGTFGLMGSYSSFYSHHIATMEGGCITTDNEELYHILLTIRAHGWTRNLPEKNLVTGNKSNDTFEESFKFVLPGYNVRPLEMSGAIGTEQLKKLPNFIKVRRDNAKYFQKIFSNHPAFTIQKEIGDSSWFGFALILKRNTPIDRSKVIKLLTENNIDSRPIVTGNFLKNKSVLDFFDYDVRGTITNAEYLDQNGFFVGNHHTDIKDKIDYMADILKNL